MRIFRDTENNNLITESELRKEWSEHGNPKCWEHDTFICRIGE